MSEATVKTEYREGKSPLSENKRVDIPYLIITLALIGIGLISLLSASSANALYYYGDRYYFIKSQLKYAVIGFVIMFLVSKVYYKFYYKMAWPIAIVSYALLILTLFNRPLNNARRWIILGGFTFQPSEIVKFAVIILFAKLAADNDRRMNKLWPGFMQFGLILAMVVAVLMLQPHFSCTVLILIIGCSMMLVAGSKFKWFGTIGLAGAVVLGSYIMFSGKLAYIQERIYNWIHPFTSTTTSGYQTKQGLLAIGSGGLMGVGIGNSRQKQLYVPEAQNDFIFSIITEELGFIGAVLIIILFMALTFRGFAIATKCNDKFSALTVFGITMQIAAQAILNIGVVTNTIPNTGISLPFFSQGGTSLVILMAEVGVLLNISRTAKPRKEN